MSEPQNRVGGEKIRLGRIEPFLFAVTLIVATILYLATREPILAAILPCLHGGWNTCSNRFHR